MKWFMMFFLSLLIGAQTVTSSAFALTEEQALVELEQLDAEELDAIAENIEEQGLAQKDKKLKKFFKKIAEKVRSLGKRKDLTDEQRACRKQKRKDNFNKFARNIGKGLTWFSIETMRPFMNSANFLKGFFEKKDKNADLEALSLFFLKHEADFALAYEGATTFEDYLEKMNEVLQDILAKKAQIILTDILKAQGIKLDGLDQVQSIEDLDLLLQKNNMSMSDLIALAKNLESLNPSVINNHPEFQDLKPLLGEISKEQIVEFVTSQSFTPNKEIDLEALFKQEKVSLIVEGLAAITGQIIVPKAVVGIISGAVGGVVGGAIVAADVGAAISMGICASNKVQATLNTDAEMAKFCSYVLYRSAHKLMKSKSKGYTKGKAFRRKVSKHGKLAPVTFER
jgi:hypothetical protein